MVRAISRRVPSHVQVRSARLFGIASRVVRNELYVKAGSRGSDHVKVEMCVDGSVEAKAGYLRVVRIDTAIGSCSELQSAVYVIRREPCCRCLQQEQVDVVAAKVKLQKIVDHDVPCYAFRVS